LANILVSGTDIYSIFWGSFATSGLGRTDDNAAL